MNFSRSLLRSDPEVPVIFVSWITLLGVQTVLIWSLADGCHELMRLAPLPALVTTLLSAARIVEASKKIGLKKAFEDFSLGTTTKLTFNRHALSPIEAIPIGLALMALQMLRNLVWAHNNLSYSIAILTTCTLVPLLLSGLMLQFSTDHVANRSLRFLRLRIGWVGLASISTILPFGFIELITRQ